MNERTYAKSVLLLSSSSTLVDTLYPSNDIQDTEAAETYIYMEI